MTGWGDDIPPHVLRFLEESIDSVPQLETLLMMFEDQDRVWLVADVASRNYTSEQRAVETLNALMRRHLVSSEGEPPRFCFKPTKDETRALVADLARCYQKNLSRIAMLIHSKPSASVTEFARAFDLKKDR
jgi:hypothetical protein